MADEKSKVLLIDDSVTVLESVKEFLERENVQVLTTTNGQDAIEAFQGSPDIKLVLCDYNMPGMNGIETVEKIRAISQDKLKPPVFMLTTETNQKIMMKAKSAGVNGWIVKPISIDAVIKLVEKFC